MGEKAPKGTVYKETSWDIGDGLKRWSRGIAQPGFLITLVKPDWLTYVVGCHIKHVKVTQPIIEVIRMFKPGCEGIGLIEGFIKKSIFAIAEIGNNNRVLVYRADQNDDVLLAELKGQPDYDYVSVEFTTKDLVVALTGAPSFKVIVWKWTKQQLLMAVSTLERVQPSGLAINGVNHHLWAEWSRNHLTFHELQEYTENSVTFTNIPLPANDCDLLYPDPTTGDEYQFEVLSVAWTHYGELFALNDSNGLYKVDYIERQRFQPVGQLDVLVPNTSFYRIVPYDSHLGAFDENGILAIVQVRNRKFGLVKTIEFNSMIDKYLPVSTAINPKSFFAITHVEKTTQYVLDGKIKNTYILPDILLSEIISVCFIEREVEYVAAINERGVIFVLDAASGNIFTKWDFPFVATSILCHPIHPFVTVGTINGYIYYIDIRDVKQPRIIHQVYVMRAVIDKLEFTGRGRLLIASDTKEGYLFLLQALATTDFDFLDCTHVAGYIRAINIPVHYKDQRLQVLSNYHIHDEVPFLLNNFHLESDYFELVSSQQLDTPISTISFSNYKRFMYAFTHTTRRIGLIRFSEDLQAGSLKEPDTTYNCKQALDVSFMKVFGENLFTFGQDGRVMIHKPPAPKQASVETIKAIQTHFCGNGGIRHGVLSMNGLNMLTVGFDNTITFVQIAESADKVDWSSVGYGPNFPAVIEAQRTYYKEYKPDLTIDKIVEGEDDGHGVIYKINMSEEREFLERYEPEREAMLEEIEEIRLQLRQIMEVNEAKTEDVRLGIEEFEINEEASEEIESEYEAKLQNIRIILSSLYELREEWIKYTNALTFGRFEIPGCHIKGFKYNRLVENYAQLQMKNEFLQDVLGVKHTRRLEKKLKKATGHINLAAYQIHLKWTSLQAKLNQHRHISLSNAPADVQRQIIGTNTSVSMPGSPGPPKSPKPDYYQKLLKRIDNIKPNEYEEEFGEYDEDGDEGSVGGMSMHHIHGSQSQQLDFQDQSKSNSEDDEEKDEEEEEKERLDPQIIKRILEATGIPMSVQALAAQGKISLEIALQALEDEFQLHNPKRVRNRKYHPKRKKANLLLFQALSKKVKPTQLEPLDLARPKEEETEEEEEFVEEEEVEEEIEIEILRKKIRVVKEVDPDTGKEIIEYVRDSSEDSSDELAMEDIEIQHERFLAESALTGEEDPRYSAIVRMLSGNLIWKQYEPSLVFYSQAELYSIQQIRSQMILIQAEILNLQELFNNAFQECREYKALQIQSISIRNTRIREIARYFEIKANIKDIELHADEDIIQVFTVHDDEVPFERYISTEERRRADEAAKLAEKQKSRSRKKDKRPKPSVAVKDPTEQAPEVESPRKQREALLKEDVPKPEFMLEKEQWEWNYEEYMEADEYYKNVEEHEKKRQEYREELQHELRALLRANKEARQQFDNRLHALFRYKHIVEKNILLEELKWVRLQRRIFEYYGLQKEYETQKNLLAKQQDRMKYTQNFASQIIARVEECTRRFDEILERDQALEQSFKEDLGPDVQKFHMEQFLKLYRKRPKLIISKSQLLDLTIMMIRALQTPNLRWFSNENGELGQKAVNAIYEFDNPFFNPPNCPRTIWERFVHIRRQRLICEYEAKATASDLIELQNVLQECDDRIEELSDGLAVQLEIVAQHREYILDLIHDVELQLIMKNGKVEIPSSQYYEDFQDVALLDKKGVVECNIKILKEGAIKMAALHKLKNIHKQLKNLEWKFKQSKLTEKHLLLQEKDIMHTRVSKEILGYLSEHANFSLVQEQRLSRVLHFQDMAEQFHKRFLQARGNVLNLFKKLLTRKEYDNEEKDTFLDQQNLKVNIQLNSVQRENPEIIMRFHEERIQMLMELGAMMRQIAYNSAMICKLESELDRLYQKTFPLL